MLYKDKNCNSHDRTIDLISRMSIEEKIRQLVTAKGWDAYDNNNGCLTVSEKYKAFSAGDSVGSLYGVFRACTWTGKNYETGIVPENTAKIINEIQKYTIENSRWGIPLFIAEEGVHGLMALGGTVFPTGLGQASTFHLDLIERMARVIADETKAIGANISYGPELDIARELRWSRVEETYGEDPYLTSVMGEKFVMGLQYDGKIISTLKAIAAYGQPEGGHNSAPSGIGNHELFNIHLPAFKKAVEACALSVMSSYNDIDGVPCTANHKLLTEILRDKWGFNGFVVSDAVAINVLCDDQRVAKDYAEAASMALKAGIDSDLLSNPYLDFLKEAYEKGLVEEKDIDLALYRILKLKFDIGLFENPYIEDGAEKVLSCNSHRELALDIARESLILLENKNNTLPLKNENSIAVIGPNADNVMNQVGTYTARQKSGAVSTVLDGFKKIADGIEINYAKGCKIRSKNTDGFKEAIETAKKSDVIVLVLGGSSAIDPDAEILETGATKADANDENDMECGEGFDRATLELAGVQNQLFRELKKTGKPIIVVLIQGRPLIINEISENADAVIIAWYPGMEGGTAIAEAILGYFNPSGKLPVSVPVCVGQLPVFYNATMERRDYVDMPSKPLYSFGYGKSYTEFTIENIRLDKNEIAIGESTKVFVDVTNVGDCDGAEVVQLYIRDDYASIVRPLKQLSGFKKVYLKKGESKELSIEITPEVLSFYNSNGEMVLERGSFTVMVGNSSENTIKTVLNII